MYQWSSWHGCTWKRCTTNSWVHTEHTERPRRKRCLLLWTHWILSCYFFWIVSKMVWQDTKSWCWTATGEDGWTAALAMCCLSSAPQPQVWGVALGGRLLLPPPLCLCIPEISLCVHIFIRAKLHPVALAGKINLASSFALLTVFVYILLIYLFLMMHPALQKQGMLTSNYIMLSINWYS